MALKRVTTAETVIEDRSQIRLSDLEAEIDGPTEQLALSIYTLLQNGDIEIHPYNDVIRVEKID